MISISVSLITLSRIKFKKRIAQRVITTRELNTHMHLYIILYVNVSHSFEGKTFIHNISKKERVLKNSMYVC